MNATIDVETLKQRVDLVDLAGRASALKKIAAHEWAGPCPKCGGTDRLHVKHDAFFCRQCHERWGDCVDYAMWLHGVDFRRACEILGGDAAQPTTATPRQPERKDEPPKWKTAKWQAEAKAELAAAVARLQEPDGGPGRAYLQHRGLRCETWHAWGLGYGMAYHWTKDERDKWQREDLGMAIWLPHQRDSLAGIKWRILKPTPAALLLDPDMRYWSRNGGQCLGFGLGMASGAYCTLFLVEGELNCLSIWQALIDLHAVNWDVVSIGSDSGISDKVLEHARQYRQVIAWLDKPDRVAEAMAKIDGAHGIRSPEHNGQKLDANAQLTGGILSDFLRAAWTKCDQADAGKMLSYVDNLGGAA